MRNGCDFPSCDGVLSPDDGRRLGEHDSSRGWHCETPLWCTDNCSFQFTWSFRVEVPRLGPLGVRRTKNIAPAVIIACYQQTTAGFVVTTRLYKGEMLPFHSRVNRTRQSERGSV